MRKVKLLNALLLAVLASVGSAQPLPDPSVPPPAASSDQFAIAVLPDPQAYTQSYDIVYTYSPVLDVWSTDRKPDDRGRPDGQDGVWWNRTFPIGDQVVEGFEFDSGRRFRATGTQQSQVTNKDPAQAGTTNAPATLFATSY